MRVPMNESAALPKFKPLADPIVKNSYSVPYSGIVMVGVKTVPTEYVVAVIQE